MRCLLCAAAGMILAACGQPPEAPPDDAPEIDPNVAEQAEPVED